MYICGYATEFLCWVCGWVREVVLRANCFAVEPFVAYSKHTQLEKGNKNNRFITNNNVSDFNNSKQSRNTMVDKNIKQRENEIYESQWKIKNNWHLNISKSVCFFVCTFFCVYFFLCVLFFCVYFFLFANTNSKKRKQLAICWHTKNIGTQSIWACMIVILHQNAYPLYFSFLCFFVLFFYILIYVIFIRLCLCLCVCVCVCVCVCLYEYKCMHNIRIN